MNNNSRGVYCFRTVQCQSRDHSTTVTILHSKVNQGDRQPVIVRSENTVSPESDGSQSIVFDTGSAGWWERGCKAKSGSAEAEAADALNATYVKQTARTILFGLLISGSKVVLIRRAKERTERILKRHLRSGLRGGLSLQRECKNRHRTSPKFISFIVRKWHFVDKN